MHCFYIGVYYDTKTQKWKSTLHGDEVYNTGDYCFCPNSCIENLVCQFATDESSLKHSDSIKAWWMKRHMLWSQHALNF